MPLVRVQTTVLGSLRAFTALVDSGADATMIPASLLAAYGIDLSTLVQNGWSVGANGTQIPKYVFAMELWHRNRRFATQVNVLPILPVPVLGRDDFMRAFGIHFHWEVDPPEWCIRRIRNPRP
jgi:hypothetical protein